MLAESFLTAVATGGSAGGSGSSADHTAVAVNLVRRVVVVVVSRESESAGDLTVRAGRGPPGTELISASSPSHPGSITLNLVTSSVTTTVRGTTTIDSTTGATPVAAPQTPAFTPPAGSVLITSRGGTVRVGAATLVFAPGAVTRDTWISVTERPAGNLGLLATSAVYDLLAFDAATGEAVTTFAIAPRFSVTVGSAAAWSSVWYLDPVTGPQEMESTSTGGVVSGRAPALQHLPRRGQRYRPDERHRLDPARLRRRHAPSSLTFVRTGTYTLGGVLTITNPTLTFSGIAVEGSAPGFLYTGSVAITAAGASLGGPTALATLGAVSATYTLNRDLPGAGRA